MPSEVERNERESNFRLLLGWCQRLNYFLTLVNANIVIPFLHMLDCSALPSVGL